MMDGPKKTPLYDMHVKYGGRVIDFSGWLLPVQYEGIIDEHMTVRKAAGLFDVSHMGEIKVSGPQALDYLQKLVANDIDMPIGKIRYAHMLYENGGVVDDILIYRLAEQEFFLVVNASNKDKDYAWMLEVAVDFPEANLIDISDMNAEIALQGPNSNEIVQKLTKFDVTELRYYSCRRGVNIAGITCLLSRTGYTGEDGFELFCLPDDAVKLWEALMEAGKDYGIKPIGLGARDSLRFEAGMPLYGHELDKDTSPVEANLARYVKPDKPEFIGKDVVASQIENGVDKTLIGFELLDKGVPRPEFKILDSSGNEIGYVTSGSYAPAVDKNLGMGYVPPALSEPGTEIQIQIRKRTARAEVVALPFYKRKKKKK